MDINAESCFDVSSDDDDAGNDDFYNLLSAEAPPPHRSAVPSSAPNFINTIMPNIESKLSPTFQNTFAPTSAPQYAAPCTTGYGSYFGFSTCVQKDNLNGNTFVIIGAPNYSKQIKLLILICFTLI